MTAYQMITVPVVLDGNRPLFQKDGSWLRNGGKFDGSDFLLTNTTIRTEQDFNADGYIVLPQKQHVLAKVFIFLALQSYSIILMQSYTLKSVVVLHSKATTILYDVPI